MKALYILVSNEFDFYYEQFYTSVYSFKKYNKNIEVILLTDNSTNRTLTNKRNAVLEYVDLKVVVDFPDGMGNKEKSRRLKTSFRNILDGDLLFIDTDTVICDNLTNLANTSFDIGMVYEGNNKIESHPSYIYLMKHLKKHNIIDGLKYGYFNSGVIYIRDNELTREFFREWNKLYLKYMKEGITQDQPTLNYTNFKFKGIIRRLDDIYNCQTDYGIKYINRAKIIHYLGFNNVKIEYQMLFSFSKFADIKLYEEIKRTGNISNKFKMMINNPKDQIIAGVVVDTQSVAYKVMLSYQFKVLRYLYVKANTLFKLIDAMLGLVIK